MDRKNNSKLQLKNKNMDYKYSFVCNSNNDLYSLVMNCWYIDTDGNRVDVKSEIKTEITLDECFQLAKDFIIIE